MAALTAMNKYRLAALGVIVFAVALDQFSKSALIDVMADNGFRPIELTSFFRLVMVWNTGVSFVSGAFSMALALPVGLTWMVKPSAKLIMPSSSTDTESQYIAVQMIFSPQVAVRQRR